MDVVIVESPAKAKTINKYLGSDYRVLASYGHVRDLPAKDGSVRPDDDFAMDWEVDAKAKKRIDEIAKAVKDADRLILATDPDREGEAISWHVLEILRRKRALKKDVPVERVVFNAITRTAVLDAMKSPRKIDEPLVEAYLARRALDYLVGFTLSPVLWRKLPGARSAGRVQSVALRLVCDRESEIEAFRPQDYWTLAVELATPKGEVFEARLAAADGKKLGRLDIGDEATADALKKALEASAYAVEALDVKPTRRHPQPPFTTSTLQQEASRKLGFAAARTMQVAQKLYEGVDVGGETVGLITYMRTDGVQIADEAIHAARDVIGREYGKPYVPGAPRVWKTKAKNAQEAHEGIRPTELGRRPKDVERSLDPDQARLYDLIWKRTIASQMESAEIERTTAEISARGSGRILDLRATGQVIRFDGFLAVYQEGRDDDEDEENRRLPAMAVKDPLARRKVKSDKHTTEPPPRFTEATLIKRMEELGIGRPSTYASTLSILRDRGYVEIDRKRLMPEDKGRLVTAFLESFFGRYVEYDFTAGLEKELDEISDGSLSWKEVLRRFWQGFSGQVDEIKDLRVSEILEKLNEILGPHIFPPREDGADARLCPSCNSGRLSLKVGKFGAFIGCSNYPECRFTRQLSATASEDGTSAAALSENGKTLGLDPETGQEITLRSGRFGPYVQLGAGEKPKRASIPKKLEVDEISLERAIALLSLPREVGRHPETGDPITAGLGRYGPFVQHAGKYARLDGPEEVFEIGVNRAVTLLAEKSGKSKGGARPGASNGRTLGDHPTLGGAITLKEGRYGQYVNHGKINATLPKGVAADDVTLEMAVSLLAARAEKSAPAKKGRSTRKAG